MHIPDTIELVPVDALVPYARNARTHSPAQVDQLAASIREFGWTSPVMINAAGGIIAGHGRVLAAREIGMDEVPCIRFDHLSAEQERALIIADNKLALNAGWDEDVLRAELAALTDIKFDIPTIGFDQSELDRLFADPMEGADGGENKRGGMAAEFLIPPFSVLNAREGWWQDRKRQWITLGIESEVGRGENLIKRSLHERISMIMPGRAGVQSYQKSKDFIDGCRAGGMTTDQEVWDEAVRRFGTPGNRDQAELNPAETGSLKGGLTFATTAHPFDGDQSPAAQTGTSIFDPVLCELAYRWFSPQGGSVLDPFAGGSVRGIVAAACGRKYVGIDLRPEQVEANRAQWPSVQERLGGATIVDPDTPVTSVEPIWHVGDSAVLLSNAAPGPAGDGFDMVFSCPPYGDLEVYSDDPADISTLSQAEFDRAYAGIIGHAVRRLADNRFACFVVGDYRDKKGIYANFVSKTIAAFEDAGAKLYNEAILVTSVGSLPIRAAKQFRSTRKMGKTHQNVLVFVKGDPRKATEACGPVDLSGALAQLDEPEDEATPAPAAPRTPAPAAPLSDGMAGFELGGEV